MPETYVGGTPTYHAWHLLRLGRLTDAELRRLVDCLRADGRRVETCVLYAAACYAIMRRRNGEEWENESRRPQPVEYHTEGDPWPIDSYRREQRWASRL